MSLLPVNKQNRVDKEKNYEPVNKEPDTTQYQANVPVELDELVKAVGTLTKQSLDSSTLDLDGIDLGETYGWSRQTIKMNHL